MLSESEENILLKIGISLLISVSLAMGLIACSQTVSAEDKTACATLTARLKPITATFLSVNDEWEALPLVEGFESWDALSTLQANAEGLLEIQGSEKFNQTMEPFVESLIDYIRGRMDILTGGSDFKATNAREDMLRSLEQLKSLCISE